MVSVGRSPLTHPDVLFAYFLRPTRRQIDVEALRSVHLLIIIIYNFSFEKKNVHHHLPEFHCKVSIDIN